MTQDIRPVMFADYRQSTNSANRAARVALIAPLYVCMIAGTGGVYTPANIQKAWFDHHNSIILIRGNHTKRHQVLSISQHLAQIRETFGLSMTELAQVLRISRPTAYAWLNGTDPKDEEGKALISRLSNYAESLRSAGITKVEILARQPISAGKSLIDLLKSGNDVSAAIASIKFTADSVSAPSRIKRDFGPVTKVRRVRADEISAPIFIQSGDES
jgi:transcriptional regulator with XRE-family HTH domain